MADENIIGDLIIRDFVYLDHERLRSILSQVEEGVVTDVEQSMGREKRAGSDVEGGIPSLLKIKGEGSMLWTESRSETRTLHDYVYSVLESTLVEKRLLRDLRQVSSADASTAWLGLKPGNLVLARGRVVINDWQRMRAILKDYKRLAEAIRYLAELSVVQPTDHAAKIARKAERDRQTVELQATDRAQREMSLVFDSLYTGRGLVLKMLPWPAMTQYRLVAPLDQQLLRESVDYITYKHTTCPQHDWQMLGIVAAVPSQDAKPLEVNGAKGPEMETALDNLFSAMRGFEFLGVSVAYPEIALTPISVYLV